MGVGLLDQARLFWADYLWRVWKSGKWQAQPDDERLYGQSHLAEHLDEAGFKNARLYTLLSEPWLQAWLALDNTHEGFLADVERIWRRAEATADYAAAIKCALCVSSAVSFSANVSAELVGLWLQYELLRPEQAIEIARRAPEKQRAELLVSVVPFLPPSCFDQTLEVADSVKEAYHEVNRDDVLKALAPILPPALHPRLLKLACSINNLDKRANAIEAVAPYLRDDLLDEAASAASAMWPVYGVRALLGVARCVGGERKARLIGEALRLARAVEDDDDRAEALRRVAAAAEGARRVEALEDALAVARTIRSEKVNALTDVDRRAVALVALLPLLPPPVRDALVAEVLDLAGGIRDGHRFAETLRGLLPFLPDKLLPKAFKVARSVKGWWLENALKVIGPRLNPRQVAAAARSALAEKTPEARAKALTAVMSFAGPRLRDRLAREAVSASLMMKEEYLRAGFYPKLAPHVGEALAERLAEDARSFASLYPRASCLTGLLTSAPEPDRHRRSREAFDVASRVRDPRNRVALYTELLPAAAPHLLPRIVKDTLKLSAAVGKGFDGDDALVKFALTLQQLTDDHTEEVLTIVRAITDEKRRAEALGDLVPVIPAERRVPLLAEALSIVRRVDDSGVRQQLLVELAPSVNVEDLAADVLFMARAGPYGEDGGDEDGWYGGDDDDEDDDDEDDWDEAAEDKDPREDAGEEADASEAFEQSPPDVAARLRDARAVSDEAKRADALAALAPGLPAPLFADYFEAVSSIRWEEPRRQALEAAYPYLPESAWEQAFKVAASISDRDERGEAWITLSTRAPESMRRTAQEEALRTLARAINEDDNPEPFLRLAYDLPVDLLPQALEVAAELESQEDEARRANVFLGFGQDFVILHRQHPEAARQAWNRALRRLALRPRPEFLRDLTGFHHLARVLAGPKKEAAYVQALSSSVQDVCGWNWAKEDTDSTV